MSEPNACELREAMIEMLEELLEATEQERVALIENMIEALRLRRALELPRARLQ